MVGWRVIQKMGTSIANSISLSAMGSSSWPSSLTWLYLRAMYPSTTSEKAAARKMTKAKTLGTKPEMDGSSAMTGGRAMRARVRMLGRVQRTGRRRSGSAERFQDELRDGLEGVEHPVAAHRHRLGVGRAAQPAVGDALHQVLPRVRGVGNDLLGGRVIHGPAGLQGGLEVADRRGVGQIPLVVLDDEGELGQVVPVLAHIVVQVLHRLDVRLHALDLAVGDEHDAVHALQDQLAAGVVVHLPGHGVEMEARLEAADRPQVHREEIEEQGALGL